MIESPFAIFRPFSDRVRVRLYDRQDDLRNAGDIEHAESMPIADAEQTHGPSSVRVREAGHAPGTDGVATDVRGLALAGRSADCQLFAVYDPTHHVGGVLHAGWRGLVNGAIPSFVELLREEWGSDPKDFLVGVGPSLCFACSEFTDPVAELVGIDARFFDGRLADLPAIADEQWRSLGVPAGNMERHPDCTKCRADRWWSLRGQGRDILADGGRNFLTLSLI